MHHPQASVESDPWTTWLIVGAAGALGKRSFPFVVLTFFPSRFNPSKRDATAPLDFRCPGPHSTAVAPREGPLQGTGPLHGGVARCDGEASRRPCEFVPCHSTSWTVQARRDNICRDAFACLKRDQVSATQDDLAREGATWIRPRRTLPLLPASMLGCWRSFVCFGRRPSIWRS